jgi:hypothetical protein
MNTPIILFLAQYYGRLIAKTVPRIHPPILGSHKRIGSGFSVQGLQAIEKMENTAQDIAHHA